MLKYGQNLACTNGGQNATYYDVKPDNYKLASWICRKCRTANAMDEAYCANTGCRVINDAGPGPQAVLTHSTQESKRSKQSKEDTKTSQTDLIDVMDLITDS